MTMKSRRPADRVTMATPLSQAFRQDGYAIVRGALSLDECDSFLHDIEASREKVKVGRQKKETYGIRNLLSNIPAIHDRVSRSQFTSLAECALGARNKPVKGLFFDKTPSANWKVPWHQDLTITVNSRHEVPEYGPWSIKDGVHHVQPPVSVLESIVALRIHLDECSADNGALRVVPGSHTQGRLSPDLVNKLCIERGEIICEAARGDILLMSPLLLHASSTAILPSHRRVVHIEFTSMLLPNPLEWYN